MKKYLLIICIDGLIQTKLYPTPKELMQAIIKLNNAYHFNNSFTYAISECIVLFSSNVSRETL